MRFANAATRTGLFDAESVGRRHAQRASRRQPRCDRSCRDQRRADRRGPHGPLLSGRRKANIPRAATSTPARTAPTSTPIAIGIALRGPSPPRRCARAKPERGSNCDLPHAPSHREGKHRVDAHHREEQRHVPSPLSEAPIAANTARSSIPHPRAGSRPEPECADRPATASDELQR